MTCWWGLPELSLLLCCHLLSSSLVHLSDHYSSSPFVLFLTWRGTLDGCWRKCCCYSYSPLLLRAPLPAQWLMDDLWWRGCIRFWDCSGCDKRCRCCSTGSTRGGSVGFVRKHVHTDVWFGTCDSYTLKTLLHGWCLIAACQSNCFPTKSNSSHCCCTPRCKWWNSLYALTFLN